MPKIQLTDISVKALKPTGKRCYYYDKNLPGFGVRVEASGTKTYSLIYGATRKRITLGRVGLVSLADARKEAKKILAEHTLGKSRPMNITYDEAKEQYLFDCSERLKPRTLNDYSRYLNRCFKFGRTPISEITQLEIKKRISKLSETPTAKRHAFVAMKVFLGWCIKHQYLQISPMEGLSPPALKSRDRVLAPEELKLVLHTALSGSSAFHNIVALLILTGQRKGEITGLRWEWIDRNLVTLPASATKNAREHTFPLSSRSVQILNSIENDSEYVFPASVAHVRGKPSTTFNGFSKAKKQFDAELPQIAHWTLHDIRRSFSSTLAQLGTPIHVTEKLLNHVSGAAFSGVAGVYNRYSYLDEMKKAVENLETFLLA